MNEKYEIIIKENGEEKKRVRAKGFIFTAVSEEGIRRGVMANGISGLDVALLTIANEELIDKLWKDSGIESRELREKICEFMRMAKMAVEKGTKNESRVNRC